jgi:uncharacterized protein
MYTHIINENFLQEKAVEATKQKKKKGGKKLSPRNRKACHSTSTALLHAYNHRIEIDIYQTLNQYGFPYLGAASR